MIGRNVWHEPNQVTMSQLFLGRRIRDDVGAWRCAHWKPLSVGHGKRSGEFGSRNHYWGLF